MDAISTEGEDQQHKNMNAVYRSPISTESVDQQHKNMDAVYENSLSTENVEKAIVRSPNHQKKAYCSMLIFAAVSACVGAIGMGTTIGYTAPAIPLMETHKEPLQITPNEADWFGSLMNVGALIAGPIAGLLIEKAGRKSTLVFVTFPFVLGFLLICYSSHLAMLLIGRILTGFSTGMVSLAANVYISEISPPAIRGQLASGFQLGVTIGIVYAFSMGYFLYWTWLAIACSAIGILLGFFAVFIPETPFWLIKHGLPQRALRALVFLRPADWDVNAEFQELSAFAQKKNLVGRFSLKMLKDPTAYKPLTISLFIMAFQQLCGINAVVFYTVSIFKNAGSSIDPGLSTIIIGVTQFVASLCASFVVDKIGRRLLLLISGAGMCISLAVFGVYYYMVQLKGSDFQTEYGWIPLTSLVAFNIAFSIGYGPIPFLLMAEILPLRIKGFGSGLAVATNWFSSFLITQEFSNMLSTLGAHGTYFFFAACCLCSCIFVFIFVPETKGHSLEEIEQKFSSGKKHVILTNDDYEG